MLIGSRYGEGVGGQDRQGKAKQQLAFHDLVLLGEGYKVGTKPMLLLEIG